MKLVSGQTSMAIVWASSAWAADDVYAFASAVPASPVLALGGVVGALLYGALLHTAPAALRGPYASQVRPLIAAITLHAFAYGLIAAGASTALVSCVSIAALTADIEFGLRFLTAAVDSTRGREAGSTSATTRLARARLLGGWQAAQWTMVALYVVGMLLRPDWAGGFLLGAHTLTAGIGVMTMLRLRRFGVHAAEKLSIAWLPLTISPALPIININNGLPQDILYAAAALMGVLASAFYIHVLHPEAWRWFASRPALPQAATLWRKKQPRLKETPPVAEVPIVSEEADPRIDELVLFQKHLGAIDAPEAEPMPVAPVAATTATPPLHFNDLQHTTAPILLLNVRDGRCVLSRGAVQLLGLPVAHAGTPCVADDWLANVPASDAAHVKEALQAAAAPSGQTLGVNLRLIDSSAAQHVRHLRLQGVRASLADHYVLASLLDMSHEYATQEQAVHEAQQDPISSLLNKAAFVQGLHEAWRQHPNGVLCSIVVRNLDQIYQLGGRRCGDFIVRKLAARVQAACLPSDMAGRLGDNTLIAFFAQSDPVRRKILEHDLRQNIAYGAREIMPYIALEEMTAAHQSEHTAADWVLQAEQLWRTPAAVMPMSDDDALAPDILTLPAELQQALPEGRLVVHYQPIVRLQDRQIAGVEAVMRWNHPRYGLIDAPVFKQTALQSGILPLLSRFVLATAAEHLAKWQRLLAQKNDSRAATFFASVNILREQLNDDSLAEDIRALLAAVPLQTQTLRLEMNEEGAALTERGLTVMQQCMNAGVLFMANNFGEGITGLADVCQLSLAGLKLSPHLVHNAYNAALPDVALRSRVMLRSILTMARDMGLETLAAGIGTATVADKLLLQSCSYAQGTLFGAVMTDENFTALLLQNVAPQVAARAAQFFEPA